MPAITKHQVTAEALEQRTSGYAWYALGLLTLVYVLNFLDRTLIYILFTPIKKEMGFSDLQLALLGTTSFVIFYTALGIPFGRLSDRVVRKNMIAGGLAVWSIFSGLTGFANSFRALFFCRVMVGVGEATLGPRGAVIAERLFSAAPARDCASDLFFRHSSGRGPGFLPGRLGWSALRLALGVLPAWLSRTVHSGAGFPAQGKAAWPN